MTQFIHKTNRLNSKPPAASEIQQGEICLNTFSLGSPSNGINNGRLYIKTDSAEVRRFISLGLPGSNDPSLKTKYGGNNNTFDNVTSNSDTSYDSLMIFRHSSAGNHIINKTATNKLTWSSGDNRLNINRSSSAQATLHIGGDVCIDTVNNWTTGFTSNFQIIGRDIGDNNRLKQVSSASLLSLSPANSIPVTALSGAIPLANGGTGANLTALSPSEGNILYYSVSGSRFAMDNDLRWDSLNNLLILNGGFQFNPSVDSLNNAVSIGVNSANRIVRMDHTFNQNLSTNSQVMFNTLRLDNISSTNTALVIDSMQTDTSPFNAVPIGIDSSDRVVKMNYTYNQNLNTADTVKFNKIDIDNSSSALDAVVINNLSTDSSPYSATPIGIDSADRIIKLFYTYDQNLRTTDTTIFNKLILNNTAFATDVLKINNIPTSPSPTSDKVIGIDSSNNIVKIDYSINQNLRTTDNITFNKLTLSAFGNDALTITNMSTDTITSVVGTNSSNNLVKSNFSINQNLNTTNDITFNKLVLSNSSSGFDALVISNLQTNFGGGTALEIDAGGNVLKSSSTRRVKENITEYTKGLDSVLSMSPKYFNMINDPSKTLRAGLIAEDLVDLNLEEFVVKDSDDNPSAINYDKLVVLLINAIKELKNRLDNISSN